MDQDERMTSNEDIGAAIKKRREALGYSQERLAGVADVARTTVVNVEAGRGARPASLRRIAKALDTTPEALTGPSPDADAITSTTGSGKTWNLLEYAQRLRDMADDLERQAEEEQRARERGA